MKIRRKKNAFVFTTPNDAYKRIDLRPHSLCFDNQQTLDTSTSLWFGFTAWKQKSVQFYWNLNYLLSHIINGAMYNINCDSIYHEQKEFNEWRQKNRKEQNRIERERKWDQAAVKMGFFRLTTAAYLKCNNFSLICRICCAVLCCTAYSFINQIIYLFICFATYWLCQYTVCLAVGTNGVVYTRWKCLCLCGCACLRVRDREFGRHAQIFVGDSMEKLEIVRVINCWILTHEVDPVCGVCDVYISFGCLRGTVYVSAICSTSEL